MCHRPHMKWTTFFARGLGLVPTHYSLCVPLTKHDPCPPHPRKQRLHSVPVSFRPSATDLISPPAPPRPTVVLLVLFQERCRVHGDPRRVRMLVHPRRQPGLRPPRGRRHLRGTLQRQWGRLFGPFCSGYLSDMVDGV